MLLVKDVRIAFLDDINAVMSIKGCIAIINYNNKSDN